MAHLSGDSGQLWIQCSNLCEMCITFCRYPKGPYSLHAFQYSLDSTSPVPNTNYTFHRTFTTNMNYNETFPVDYEDFLRHHESYDFYDNLYLRYQKGSLYYTHVRNLDKEYEMWKKYPDRPFLRPGRRIHQGAVIKIDVRYERFGPIKWVTLELPDHNLLELRMPKNSDWRMGDIVEVAATVDVLNKPHVGIGRNPRVPKPSGTLPKSISVSDFLPSKDKTWEL